MSFEDFGLDALLLRSVAAAGYTTPSPIQLAAIPVCMEGRDVLGCAQTGTGKTAAFALPILHRLLTDPIDTKHHRTRVLVLSPTRELAVQTAENFEKYAKKTKLRVVSIFGGVSQHWQAKDVERGVDIIVATPGRLLDLMNQGIVSLGWVDHLVLDEADHMLDMGFLPDVQRIIAKVPADRQALLFSATMPAPIRELAKKILRDPVSIQIEPEQATTDLVNQGLYLVTQANKPAMLEHFLSSRSFKNALVFTRTKHGADQLVKKLDRVGIAAEAIHGNKTQASRQRTLGKFRSDDLKVLIATDIAARGLDISGIEYVVNYDMPLTAETYVHRIGRTGRAGQNGIAVSFCSGDERDLLRDVEREIQQRVPLLDDQPEHLFDSYGSTTPGKTSRGGRSSSGRSSSGRSSSGRSSSERSSAVRSPGRATRERVSSDRGSSPRSSKTAKLPTGQRSDVDSQKSSRRSGSPYLAPKSSGPKREHYDRNEDARAGRPAKSSNKKPATKTTRSISGAVAGQPYESLRDKKEREEREVAIKAAQSSALRNKRRMSNSSR